MPEIKCFFQGRKDFRNDLKESVKMANSEEKVTMVGVEML